MSLTRKAKRKNMHKTSCCGSQMMYKAAYDVYVCGKCGKERRIPGPDFGDMLAKNR